MSTRKGGLGRGLGALIPTSEPVQLTKSVAGVEVEVANLKEVLILNSHALFLRNER